MWQLIETAPTDGTCVLVWAPRWLSPRTAQWYGDDWRMMYELGPFRHQPTHWMPVPQPPHIES